MKAKFYKLFICIFLISGLFKNADAQISFPNGDTLNLNTGNSLLYIETRILFHTGNFKSSDYKWDKISDSININWIVSACFNGDCKNDLLQSGNFIKDFGLNDTTCFIAFHVQTNNFPGTSVIKYNVYNKNNMFDNGNLIFNITYSKLAEGINEISGNNFSVYPNPATNNITVQSTNDMTKAQIKIVNILGVPQFENTIAFSKNNADVDVSSLPQGIYYIHLQSNDKIAIQKFIKH